MKKRTSIPLRAWPTNGGEGGGGGVGPWGGGLPPMSMEKVMIHSNKKSSLSLDPCKALVKCSSLTSETSIPHSLFRE